MREHRFHKPEGASSSLAPATKEANVDLLTLLIIILIIVLITKL